MRKFGTKSHWSMVSLIDFIFHLFLPLETSEMIRNFLLITKTTQPRPLSFSSFNCLLNNLAILRAIPHLFKRLFVISLENNRDCHITMLLSLKTMEVQIKGSLWNNRFRAVRVYWILLHNWGHFFTYHKLLPI